MKAHLAGQLGGADVYLDLALPGLVEKIETRIDEPRRLEHPCRNDPLASVDVLPGEALKVDRGPHARHCPARLLSMNLDVPDPRLAARRLDLDLLVLLEHPLLHGPGDHGTEALDREHPVHGQNRNTGDPPLFKRTDLLVQDALELLYSVAVHRADGNDRGVFQESVRYKIPDIGKRQLQEVVVHHVGLGEHDHAALNAQQAADLDVLDCLRHHSLVCGHNQHDQVDSRGPGEHVPDETYMTGHIHHTHLLTRWQIQRRKAQLDGETALLFLLQPVAVHAGHRLDEGCLPVIHVSSSADDDSFHNELVKSDSLRIVNFIMPAFFESPVIQGDLACDSASSIV
ncbi:MAG: hypothetical protein BWZ01_02995 [Deltaproteobacteria bacterium ADurb.BinA179]|nr:MAG: hypothetical protein BWZ01_02995 [Deltaproteobacteria bacterium ADurb.BinA179]